MVAGSIFLGGHKGLRLDCRTPASEILLLCLQVKGTGGVPDAEERPALWGHRLLRWSAQRCQDEPGHRPDCCERRSNCDQPRGGRRNHQGTIRGGGRGGERGKSERRPHWRRVGRAGKGCHQCHWYIMPGCTCTSTMRYIE
ncbi:hypothetical protein GBAR_LOCUS17196, partial [Geodia barretti]